MGTGFSITFYFKTIMNKPLKQKLKQSDAEIEALDFGNRDYQTQGRTILLSRLTILLLSSLLIFLLTPPGKNWLLKQSSPHSPEANLNQPPEQPTALPVKTVTVNSVNRYQVQRTYTGTIIPRLSSSLGFERSGTLINLIVDRGQRVNVGEPLAFLDTQLLKAQKSKILAQKKQVNAQLQELLAGSRPETIAAAQATVKSWQTRLELAQTKSQRRQELYKEGAISLEQLDEAIAEVNTLEARLNEAQNQLSELQIGTRPEQIEAQQAMLEELDAELTYLEIQIKQSILKAPFSGTIAELFLDEGVVVSSGQPILKLVEDQVLEAQIDVPIKAALQVKVGSLQQVQIGAKTYQSQVISILPQVNSVTHTLTIILQLNGTLTRQVRAGQIIRLNLDQTIINSGYWIPTTTLVKDVKGLWSCYVLGKPEILADDSYQVFRVERRVLEVIHTQGDRVFVRGTLQDGDQVIINGNHRIVPGQLVTYFFPDNL